jgi:5-methylthioadenosine/S-adenosylhomocysteine deaminase
VEVGKRADLILLNLDHLHTTPQPDLIGTIVYAAETSNVETVLIDGQILLREGSLLTLDETEVIADAKFQAQKLKEAVQQN